jgi:hypothetical protein
MSDKACRRVKVVEERIVVETRTWKVSRQWGLWGRRWLRFNQDSRVAWVKDKGMAEGFPHAAALRVARDCARLPAGHALDVAAFEHGVFKRGKLSCRRIRVKLDRKEKV